MRLRRAPLWLLGAALVASLRGGCWGSPSHSLSYFYLQLPEPNQELPQFFLRSYLDDQPIARFDSLTRKMEPLVPWMEEVEKETFLAPERVFRADLEELSELDRHAGGLHTWQAVLGCELMEDGSKGWFLHYGYNATDFISFDKETLRWVAAQSQAQKVKEKWEEDPRWTEKMKSFLEKTCIEGLQKYLPHKKEAPKRIATKWLISLGIVADMILGLWILFLSCWRRWRCRKKRHQEETSCSDQVSLKMLPSSPSAEDEIQL